VPVNPERGKLWLPPGVHEGEQLADPRSPFPRYPLVAASGVFTSLASIAKDFAFFTLAIPMKIQTFNDAYLHDLASVSDSKFRLYQYSTPRAFFKYLDIGNDPKWNYTFYAVRQYFWKETLDFLCSVGLLDKVTGHYHKFMQQEFTIPDPQTGGPGAIKLSVIAVNSTKGQFIARRNIDGMLHAIRAHPDPKFVKFGVAVVAGHPDPMSLIEDNTTYNVPDVPFQQPVTKRMDELTAPDQRRVIKSIEEIKSARERGEFPAVRW